MALSTATWARISATLRQLAMTAIKSGPVESSFLEGVDGGDQRIALVQILTDVCDARFGRRV
jgi:hypothetical protein